jgi:uncharacterized membrane protein YgdD (TMEM256/DUF423 family)
MSRVFLFAAAVLGGLAVAAGAFGAHALRDRVSARSLEIFETAARYQLFHALALALVALLAKRPDPPAVLGAAGYAFLLGTVVFSGSLYALSVSGIKGLGAITPIGGAFYLLGWACLAVAAWSIK